ncbi:putative histone-lysine N-methyltransferase PRDM6 [Glandiceps talaboti]
MAFQRVTEKCTTTTTHPYQFAENRRPPSVGTNMKGKYSMNNNVYITSFSYDDLYYCLYGCNKIIPVRLPPKNTMGDTAESCESWCDICKESHQGECPMHGPLHSLRKLVNANSGTTRAPKHFPDEVALCTSSLPGATYGVCAIQRIPAGTWLGPFEGERVSIEDTKIMANTDHLWEVYNEAGDVEYFVNGADEKNENWMRHIRCARSRREQNLCVVQYKGAIYYRVCREIIKGMELLVWYDDRYVQYMGIPISLKMADKDTAFPSPPSDDEKNAKRRHLDSTPSILSHYIDTERSLGRRERADSNDNIINVKIESNNSEGHRSPFSDTSLSPNSANLLRTKTVMGICPTSSTNINAPNNQLDWNMWRCGQCFKTFTQRIMLQMHICPKNPDKPYQCGHCSQSFSQASELRNHVVTHSNERPFKCGFCGRAFAGATTLNNHIRTHTGEKPFKCDKCERCFTQASQLSRHQRTPGECNPRNLSHDQHHHDNHKQYAQHQETGEDQHQQQADLEEMQMDRETENEFEDL